MNVHAAAGGDVLDAGTAHELLQGEARGRDGGVRQELAAGAVQWKPRTEVEATSILLSLNVKTVRSWRGIVAFTHLAREGAYDSHHRTAGIAGCTRRRGSGLAARGRRPQTLQNVASPVGP